MSTSADKVRRFERLGPWGQRCALCERRCRINRLADEQGFCGATAEARVYRHRVEFGEELELVPSHLFYLSGCSFRCAFCIAEQNGIDPRRGQPLTARFLADAVVWGRQRGARNIQWVGGEPSIHIPSILVALDDMIDLPPVVWKSNFYHTPQAALLLEDVVDVYVADFKFGNDQCAQEVAGAGRYLEVVGRNLLVAAERSDLIVRHLLLPGHFDCCFQPIVRWMHEHLPAAKFNILGGYLPCWQAHLHVGLDTPIGRTVLSDARRVALESGLNLIR